MRPNNSLSDEQFTARMREFFAADFAPPTIHPDPERIRQLMIQAGVLKPSAPQPVENPE